MARRWTTTEKIEVFKRIGSMGWGTLRRCAGHSYLELEMVQRRSVEAVRRQVRRMALSGARRGSISLRELSQSTGYNPEQLRRAQRALNQSWRRMSARGAHLISDDQARDLVAWLQHDFWNSKKKLYGCVWCATSARPHHSGGLCQKCFFRYRRRCLERGFPTSLKQQRRVLSDIILDCADEPVHGRFLEEARQRLNSGLALTETLLDWWVIVHDRNDPVRTDP